MPGLRWIDFGKYPLNQRLDRVVREVVPAEQIALLHRSLQAGGGGIPLYYSPDRRQQQDGRGGVASAFSPSQDGPLKIVDSATSGPAAKKQRVAPSASVKRQIFPH